MVASLYIRAQNGTVLNHTTVSASHDSRNIGVAHEVGVHHSEVSYLCVSCCREYCNLTLIGVVERYVLHEMTLSVERSGELANRFPVVAGHVDIILEREVAREVVAHVHEVLRSCYRIVDVGHCDVERDGLSAAESVALCRHCNGRLAQRDEVERGAAHLNSRRIGACDAHLASQC